MAAAGELTQAASMKLRNALMQETTGYPSCCRLLTDHRLGRSSNTFHLLLRVRLGRLLLQIGVDAIFVDQPHATILPWLRCRIDRSLTLNYVLTHRRFL